MKTLTILRASLVALSATLLPACGDILDAPEDTGAAPNLGTPSPAPAPAPAPTSSIPTKAQLAGTWRTVRDRGVAANETTTLTFLTDNTYIFGGEVNTTNCNPTPANAGTFANYDGNGNGVEFGEYVYSETTGAFAASSSVFFIDSNGDCGAHETTAGATQDTFNITLVNGVLRITDPASSSNNTEFERVQRGSGIVGSWYGVSYSQGSDVTSSGEAAANPFVVSFFADGRYVLLTAEPQGTATVNMNDDPGTQVGRYALDAAGNLTVSNITTDTSKGGFGAAQGNNNERLSINASGQLVYNATDGGGAFTGTLEPLPLRPRFDTALVNGLWYNDSNDDNSFINEPDPFLAYFGPDAKFITGGAQTDDECASDYNGSGVAVEPDGNGYENGTFSADATTGRLIFTINSETDGSCGAFNRNRREQRLYLNEVAAARMSLQVRNRESDDEEAVIFRKPTSAANSLFGGWRGTTGAGGTTPDDFLIGYFDDSTAGPASGFYLAVDANPNSTCPTTDSGPRGGIEYGQYSFNGSTIDYTALPEPGRPSTPPLRTLCPTRFDPSGTQTITFSNGGLTYTDSQASTPPASYIYRKLTTP